MAVLRTCLNLKYIYKLRVIAIMSLHSSLLKVDK